MLKIKDNVDLEELEKYGFEYNERYGYYEDGYDRDDVRIYIFTDDRLLNCWTPFDNVGDTTTHLDTLYDLIKADLVVKVDD